MRTASLRFHFYLSNDEIVKGVMMWNDEIFLDVHQLIGSDGSQLMELFPQRIQATL
jgi:hypothetical protein